MKGFLMSLEIAEKFYKLCAEREAPTEEERLNIMYKLLHEENIKIIKDNQLKEITKNKNVLFLKSKKQ